MFVWSLKEGESMRIGKGPNQVRVVGLKPKGRKARIGIDVADEVEIHIEEPADVPQAERATA